MPLILSGTNGVSGVDGSAGTPSYQGTDTNTGIFYPAADTIAFAEGGVESMRIDSSGNVLVGTTTQVASARLTLSGSATLASTYQQVITDGTRSLRLGANSTAAEIQSTGGVPLYINYGGNDVAMVSQGSGNVGIGTSSPSATLDVRNTSNEQIRFGYTGTPNYCSLGRNSGTGNFNIFVNSAEPLLFGTSNTERMRITSGGLVGIGVSNPSYPLELQADNAAFGWSIRGRSLDGISVGRFANNSNTETVRLIAFNDGTFAISTTSSVTERMRIDSSGKLLVGTTSLLTTDDTGGIYWSSATGSGGVGGFEFRNTSTSTNSDANPALIIIKGSTTYTSSQRFIQFNANAGSQAMGGIVGNGATNAQFISLSDIRDKENIEPITGSLNKIVALNPVEFDWKQTGEHINAGFIAQEVETVFPEYVVDNVANAGEEERKGITGGMSAGFIAHLVKAIQEQQAMIEELKQEVALLKGV